MLYIHIVRILAVQLPVDLPDIVLLLVRTKRKEYCVYVCFFMRMRSWGCETRWIWPGVVVPVTFCCVAHAVFLSNFSASNWFFYWKRLLGNSDTVHSTIIGTTRKWSACILHPITTQTFPDRKFCIWTLWSSGSKMCYLPGKVWEFCVCPFTVALPMCNFPHTTVNSISQRSYWLLHVTSRWPSASLEPCCRCVSWLVHGK